MITEEQEKAAFFHEMGRAFAQWALLEEGLFFIFLKSCRVAESAPLYAAFQSVENFRSRLGMVRGHFCESGYRRPIAKEGERIFRRLEAEAKVRNRLAHWAPVSYPRARVGRRYGIVNRTEFFLSVHRAKTPDSLFAENNKPPEEAIFLSAIVDAKARWIALSLDIGELLPCLDDHRRTLRPPTYPPQYEMNPGIQRTVSQIRKALSAPSESSSQ